MTKNFASVQSIY